MPFRYQSTSSGWVSFRVAVRSRSSCKFPPEQKLLPAPVMMTQLTDLSAFARFRPPTSPSITSAARAFRVSARFKVSVTIRSDCSYRTDVIADLQLRFAATRDQTSQEHPPPVPWPRHKEEPRVGH